MKMTKLLAVVVALVMLCTAVLPVSAASGLNQNEQDVYDWLFSGHDVGNTTIYFLDGRQTEFTNFFNRDGVDMTDAQKAEIMKYLKESEALLKDPEYIAWANAGNTSLAKLPRRIKEVMIADGIAACAVMGLTFVYNSANNMVTITDGDGNVLVYTAAVVKRTGAVASSLPMILSIAAMSGVLATAAFLALKSRKKRDVMLCA